MIYVDFKLNMIIYLQEIYGSLLNPFGKYDNKNELSVLLNSQQAMKAV